MPKPAWSVGQMCHVCPVCSSRVCTGAPHGTMSRVFPVDDVKGQPHGECRLCGTTGKLSRTHIPPMSFGDVGEARMVVERVRDSGLVGEAGDATRGREPRGIGSARPATRPRPSGSAGTGAGASRTRSTASTRAPSSAQSSPRPTATQRQSRGPCGDGLSASTHGSGNEVPEVATAVITGG
jgi:hypothetical protein